MLHPFIYMAEVFTYNTQYSLSVKHVSISRSIGFKIRIWFKDNGLMFLLFRILNIYQDKPTLYTCSTYTRVFRKTKARGRHIKGILIHTHVGKQLKSWHAYNIK